MRRREGGSHNFTKKNRRKLEGEKAVLASVEIRIRQDNLYPGSVDVGIRSIGVVDMIQTAAGDG